MASRIKRGDIFWLDLGGPVPSSHVMADLHPVVVVQCDDGNDHSSLTVVVVGTTTIKRVYSWDCILEAGEGGLQKRTRICCNQIMTIEQVRLEDVNRIGRIPDTKIPQLNRGLKYNLQLT